MNMKSHILAALREQLEAWEATLARLGEAAIVARAVPSDWSIKDELAHLWAWQQRTLARVEAARLDREPEFPAWPFDPNDESEEGTERINTWIYETNRDLPWSTVHQNWRDCFLRVLDAAERISERDMLDSGRYAWLNGHAIAVFLLGTYDHHQEHFEKLSTRL
ncbi:MAG: ClbS/DfsB family four-helix bundle protein [Thermoflexales bacterium]|nr:ClbS/DfsB family four-helix bundle protein [Thermoflexales bacterium]